MFANIVYFRGSGSTVIILFQGRVSYCTCRNAMVDTLSICENVMRF